MQSLFEAMQQLSTVLDALYPDILTREALGITARYVVNCQPDDSHAAIAVPITTASGVAYYLGLKAYEGRILRCTPHGQYSIVELGLLDRHSQEAITAQLKSKAEELQSILAQATVPAT